MYAFLLGILESVSTKTIHNTYDYNYYLFHIK